MMTAWHNKQELLHACVFGLCTVYSWIKSSVKFIYLRADSGCVVRIIGIMLNCFFSLGSYLTEYTMSQIHKPFLRVQRQPHSEMPLRMIITTLLEGSLESRQ